jgi:hypothetical protein
MAKTLANRVIETVVKVTPAKALFVAGERDIRVAVPTARLQVRKDGARLGVRQQEWFDPLADVHHAELGVTVENALVRGGSRPTEADELYLKN